MTTLLLTAAVTGYHAPLAPFHARRHCRAVACADAEPPEFLTLASLGLNADEQAALEVLLQKHDVREREREIDGIPQPWEADGDVSVDDPKSRLYQLFHDDFDGLFARRRQWEQAVAGRKLWLTAWQPTLIAAPLIAGWFAPRRAAAWCARSSFALHLGLPLLWVGFFAYKIGIVYWAYTEEVAPTWAGAERGGGIDFKRLGYSAWIALGVVAFYLAFGPDSQGP